MSSFLLSEVRVIVENYNGYGGGGLVLSGIEGEVVLWIYNPYGGGGYLRKCFMLVVCVWVCVFVLTC